MSNFLEDLRKYFENTSDEQFRKDWEKATAHLSECGPTVGEFIEHLNKNYGPVSEDEQ